MADLNWTQGRYHLRLPSNLDFASLDYLKTGSINEGVYYYNTGKKKWTERHREESILLAL
jgi:hypothetical protein